MAQSPSVVRLVLPFPSGNPVDTSLRKAAELLQKQTGRTHIVDNKPGAAGLIGSVEVAKSRPDGATILYTTGSHTTTAVLHKKLPYDVEKDFVPITKVGDSPGFLLLVPASSPYRSIQDLLAAAKANPGTVSYGSAGVGNGTHILGALLERSAHVRLVHAPYRTSPIPDLVGGHIQMLFWGTANSKQLVEEGRVRALAMSGSKRWAELPNVPALGELGHGGVTVGAWSGFFAPGGTPAATVDRIYRELVAAYQDPELRNYVTTTMGTSLSLTPPSEFQDFLRAEMQTYSRTLVPLGITME
jgi:tripartite-type tricarboxylate transporter receptor subunit TctC